MRENSWTLILLDAPAEFERLQYKIEISYS
jgi:hypothetical protein